MRYTLLLPIVAALVLASPTVSASEAAAHALFQEGRTLMDSGKVETACKRFKQSLELSDKLGTLMNLAVCQDKLGRTASAWVSFTSAATRAKKAGETARERFARERVAALEGKLSYVKVEFEAGSRELRVRIDDDTYTRQVLTTRIPVDPGKRRIVASAPGHAPRSLDVDVPIGPAEITVRIAALEPVGDETPEPHPPEPKLEPVPIPVEAEETSVPIASWVAWGVGGFAVVAGAVTGGLSLSRSADLTDTCPGNVCSPEEQATLDEAYLLANVSNVMWGVAAAGVAAGFIVWAVSGDDDVSVGVGPQGMLVKGAF